MRELDLPDVVRNENRAYPFPWTPGMFADCLRDTQFDNRVCLLGDQVVGHAILSTGAGEAHVLNICIARRFQGFGWGRELMRHLLDRAARLHGARTVFLEVRPSNEIALALYRSMGFREVGRRRNYYPAAVGHEDAIVMALERATDAV
jgi:ribosomal-protein-alanine N-acetyltransferase